MENSPKITWVNHAGYILSYNNINVLVDPWIKGTSFNNGWNLLTESFFPKNLIDNIDYLWISHEHPDHFSPSNLKLLNNDRIRVLFQKTNDKRVVNFLKKKNFKVIEIDNYEKFELSDKFKIMLIKNDQIDSLSIFEVGDKTIINTNDCVLDKKKLNKIKKKTFIQKSDILFTQFSYASWIGNPKNRILRKEASNEKLDQIKSQIQFFKPKVTIPFASYIYFCHEENRYMNDEITNIEKVKDVIEENNSKPIFLYPGSSYEINNNKNTFESDFLKYKKDFLNINSKEFIKTKTINFEELKLNSENYLKKIKSKNGSSIMYTIYLISVLSNFFFKKDFFGFSNTKIHLSDINKFIEFDWIKGLRVINEDKFDYDVQISSESLNYIFLYEWGIGSLMINGRGNYDSEYKRWKFNRIFSLGQINSTGKTLLKKIFEKIMLKKNISLENYESSFFNQFK